MERNTNWLTKGLSWVLKMVIVQKVRCLPLPSKCPLLSIFSFILKYDMLKTGILFSAPLKRKAPRMKNITISRWKHWKFAAQCVGVANPRHHPGVLPPRQTLLPVNTFSSCQAPCRCRNLKRPFQEANQSGHMSWTLCVISGIMRSAQILQELSPALALTASHLNLVHSYHLPRSGVLSSGT